MPRICTLFALALTLLSAGCAETHSVNFLNGTLDSDHRTLIFHFSASDRTMDKRIKMSEPVIDVKRCNFMSKSDGVAFLIQTRDNDKDAFYYGTMFWDTDEQKIILKKIAAPEGKWQLVGIVNTQGDSVVATAFQHLRGRAEGDLIKGWMMFDNCAHPTIGDVPAARWVVPFEVPAGHNTR